MLPFAESMFTVSFMLSKFDFGSGLITVSVIPSPEAIKILAYFFIIDSNSFFRDATQIESFSFFPKMTRVALVQKTRLELT